MVVYASDWLSWHTFGTQIVFTHATPSPSSSPLVLIRAPVFYAIRVI